MKFTDGYWQALPGVTILRPQSVDDVVVDGETLTVYAATGPLEARGDTLNRPLIAVSLHTPMDDVVGVTIEHFQGGLDRRPAFEIATRWRT
jgi:alpha-D-xyloside xylohydrolase